VSEDKGFEAELAQRKAESTVQLLFKCARLLNETALGRVRRPGAPAVRPSHTALFPHIDLAGTRLSVLAARLGVSKQAVGQLVGELVEMGVLELGDDPSDGRAKLVRFSARGRRGLLEGLAVLRELERELAAVVGEKRMRGLHATLTDILASLEKPSHAPR
jgi:DNA-binding MarR family transcriptional regulator